MLSRFQSYLNSLQSLFPRHRRLYWLTQFWFWPIIGLVGAGVNAFVNGTLGERLHWWLAALVVWILLGIPLVWLRAGFRPRIHAWLDPDIDRTQQEIEGHARSGLIAFVSLYNPRPGSSALALSPQERRQAITNADFAALDLPNSNLKPLLAAISGHKAKLRYCWLIATTDTPERPGSAPLKPVIEAYFKNQENIPCTFFCAEVPQEDDDLLCKKVRERVEAIFQQAADLGLKAPDIICDATGAVRGMQLGMILACADAERDLQLMGVHYDNNGQPTGEPFRMRIHFELVEVPAGSWQGQT